MEAFLDTVLAELQSRRGLDLTGYRRAMLLRRLNVRMNAVSCPAPETYLNRLRTEPTECDRLIDAIAINVSEFFRNPATWAFLGEVVLPDMLDRKAAEGHRELRIWCAGCASGEEAYSIAILIVEALEEGISDWAVHIFATDIDQHALRIAEQGAFDRSQIRNVQVGALDRHFVPARDRFEIRPSIRSMVSFDCDDLVSPARQAPAGSVFGTFDLVLCRNVLIYFSVPLQTRVLAKLRESLAVGGVLVLGHSESIARMVEPGFEEVAHWARVYRRKH